MCDTAASEKKEVGEWYVLIHYNPQLIETMLKKEVARSPQSPLKFFIPFRSMKSMTAGNHSLSVSGGRTVYDPTVDTEGLRIDLHNFVFVCATEDRVESLVTSDWNKDLRMPLRYYRDTKGGKVTVTNEEMIRFKRAIKIREVQYSIGQPVDGVVVGEKVIITEGPMKDMKGDVMEIGYDSQGLKLKIAFRMFDDRLLIGIPGFRSGSVSFENKKSEHILYGPIIANLEEKLIELLYHRHGPDGSAELSQKDSKDLEQIYAFSDIAFEEESECAKFSALMLLCAYLLKDTEAVAVHTRQVHELLGGRSEPASPTDAYLLILLFIASHNPEQRDAVKAYRRGHPDSPDIIRRFLAIAKNIRCRHAGGQSLS